MRYRSNDNHKRWFWREHDKADYECPECGDQDGPFEVHHIDGNTGNGALGNLIALCESCHWSHHTENGTHDEPEVEGWKRGFEQELVNE